MCHVLQISKLYLLNCMISLSNDSFHQKQNLLINWTFLRCIIGHPETFNFFKNFNNGQYKENVFHGFYRHSSNKATTLPSFFHTLPFLPSLPQCLLNHYLNPLYIQQLKLLVNINGWIVWSDQVEWETRSSLCKNFN